MFSLKCPQRYKKFSNPKSSSDHLLSPLSHKIIREAMLFVFFLSLQKNNKKLEDIYEETIINPCSIIRS